MQNLTITGCCFPILRTIAHDLRGRNLAPEVIAERAVNLVYQSIDRPGSWEHPMLENLGLLAASGGHQWAGVDATAVMIEAQIASLANDCSCRESGYPCPACTEAERLDHLGREIAGTGGQYV